MLAPKSRSRFRIKAGKEYFILKRKFFWLVGQHHFAKTISSEELSHQIIQHQSVLLRQLKDVDMQLQKNKIINLHLAIAKINGIIIKPNETFSFWKLVGRPAKHKGYLRGMVLENGKVKSDFGGGLCQLGNLLYWMVLHSPLLVTQRWRHSYDVFPDVNRKIPFGCGATLSYNYIDFQFANHTENDF